MKTIPLTKGNAAMVDEEDYERVNQYKWFANETKPGHIFAFHGIREPRPLPLRSGVYGKVRVISLQRFIMNITNAIQVRHIDGNGLNCQRSNLRVINSQQPEIKKRFPLITTVSHNFPFKEMELLDAFFVKLSDGQNPEVLRSNVHSYAIKFAKKNNLDWKFSALTLKDGVRIWRTK